MSEFKIATDFSDEPLGRYLSDGDGKSNGENFRENYFLPRLRALEKNEKLNIILDQGVTSYGSSFISEGFAGVVKYGYMTSDELLNSISLVYTDPDFKFYEERILHHIKVSKYNSKKYVKTPSRA